MKQRAGIIVLLAIFGMAVAFCPIAAQEPSVPEAPRGLEVHQSRTQGWWLALWEFVADGTAMQGTFALSNRHGAVVCDGIGVETACDCEWMVVTDGSLVGGWAGCQFRNLARFKLRRAKSCEMTLLWVPDAGEPVTLATWTGPCVSK